MPKYDLSKRIVNGELTRRQMLKGLGAAGVLSATMGPVLGIIVTIIITAIILSN